MFENIIYIIAKKERERRMGGYLVNEDDGWRRK
jgi:hypothetical protein